MMKAVIEHTRIVSKYTPRACTKPCLAGCEAEAVAAAFGTEPMPASLENRPRWTPMSMIEPRAPPAIECVLKASEKIVATMPGTAPMFIATTMMPTIREGPAMIGKRQAENVEM